MYTLLCCADLYGEKMNLELTFSAMPTMGELQRKVNEVYNGEAQLKRPQGYPTVDFQIARLQIYDDVLLKWTDLVTCTQLHEYDQLYAFQPQSPWHIDVQKDLPPPRPPTVAGSSTAAPRTMAQSNTPGGYSQQAASPIPAYQQDTSMNGGQAYQSQGRSRNSPTQDRLDAQRQREEQLRAELARSAEETRRLEQQYATEREDDQRRQQEADSRNMAQREAEIMRQRQALQQAEAEYQRAQQQQNLSQGGGGGGMY